MQMREYLTKYNSLASEDLFFEIPLRKEWILKKIGRGQKVLDVGCLGGRFSRFIMDQNNEVWGVEINPKSAEAARERGIRVKIANVEEGLPFDSNEFHAVYAGQVLEYLYDTKSFFAEAHRVLKKKGKLLITVPNLNSLENRTRMILGRYPNRFGAYPEDHFGDRVRVFNLEKIEELCRQTRFQIVDVCGIPHYQSRGKWIDRSLGWVGKAFPEFSQGLMVAAQKC